MSEFLSYDVAAQAIGIVASFFLMGSYLVTSDLKLKCMMCVSFALFSFHYFMLSAFMGMFVHAIDVLRISFSMKAKKSQNMMLLFILFYIGFGVYNFREGIDILPVCASILGTISMYKLSGIRFRMVLFIICSLWLLYGLYVFSVGAIITNIFLLFANSLTIYRLYKNKQVNE